MTTSYTYDYQNHLTAMENRTGSSGVISRYTSEYLVNGQKAKEASDVTGRDGKKSTKTAAYTYDLLGRIIKETRTGSRDITYTYDSNNNRKTMTAGNRVTAYKYNKNDELLRTDTLNTDTEKDTVVIYKNDRNGNQLATVNRYEIPEEKKGKPYIDIDVTLGSNRLNKNVVNHYNAENQLVRTLTKNYKVSFTYDAEGLRTSKTVNGEKTVYVWDGDQLVLELEADGKVKKRYVRGNDLVFSDKGNGTKRQYYVTDPHGNVVQLTDGNGKVTKTYEYDSFGNEVKPEEKDDNPFRYCGEYYDKETGEVYLRARYYQPEKGRFLTRDTYTGEEDEPESLHLYAYCGNDGVNAWDPSGHKPKYFSKYFIKKYRKITGSKYCPIAVKLKKNKILVSAKINIVWAGKKKNIIKKGIEKKWSGKVKISGYKVSVKTKVITKVSPNNDICDRIEYEHNSGISYSDFTIDGWDCSWVYCVVIYSKEAGKKKSNYVIGNDAAHEFGHLLGIGDTYGVYDTGVAPKSDIMRWDSNCDIKMSKYDVFLMLKAYAYNKGQKWSGLKKKDLKNL